MFTIELCFIYKELYSFVKNLRLKDKTQFSVQDDFLKDDIITNILFREYLDDEKKMNFIVFHI